MTKEVTPSQTEAAETSVSLLLPVVNTEGKKVGEISLSPEVFGAEVDEFSVHAVVRWQRAKKRAGTHSTLNQASMLGGGRKPWKQKGTGRARAGSSNSPIWVGGAIALGPTPRSYEFKLPKSLKRRALASVLSQRLIEGNISVVDTLDTVSGKTKEFSAQLKTILCPDANPRKMGGVSVIDSTPSVSVRRATKNIEWANLLPVEGANVYDLMKSSKLVISKSGVEALTKRVTGVE